MNGEHGFSSSPLLIDGKLLLHADQLVALDAATGTPAWSMPREDPTDRPTRDKAERVYRWDHGYLYFSSMVRVSVDGQPVAVTPVNVLRPADGRILAATHEIVGNFCPSQIVDGPASIVWAQSGATTGSATSTCTNCPRSSPSRWI